MTPYAQISKERESENGSRSGPSYEVETTTVMRIPGGGPTPDGNDRCLKEISSKHICTMPRDEDDNYLQVTPYKNMKYTEMISSIRRDREAEEKVYL